MAATDAVSAFVVVFPAELPDKTMFATLVLTTRYGRPGAVWLGAASAFTVQVVLAVTAGTLLSLLPGTVVQVAVAILFAAGAVVLWRSGDDDDAESGAADAAAATPWQAFAGSFGVVLLAEFGDLTQLATVGLAASAESPLAVAAGALAALWTVAAIAVVAGRALASRLPVRLLHRVAAVIFGLLAVATIVELLLGE
ncbi:MAG: TMEM165/GDT1 family protein [Acidimicrobiales bacterium]|nr:TMEM165/GDT1 family protein [Acidimicrobiales bacterium]MCB1250241.1 TMEM165/GDT1 family protein [Acidimicrobiales bacterium]MCB1261411.1 TMEM165/GDT1 family protein [Acidimicrobiales bacterium]